MHIGYNTSCFNEVFTYHDHGSQPHIFTLSLLFGHVTQEIGNVRLELWNSLRVKNRTKMKA